MGGRGTKSVANLAALLGRARRDNGGGSAGANTDPNLQQTAPSSSPIHLDTTGNKVAIAKGSRVNGKSAKAALIAQINGGAAAITNNIAVRVPPNDSDNSGVDDSSIVIDASTVDAGSVANSNGSTATDNSSADASDQKPDKGVKIPPTLTSENNDNADVVNNPNLDTTADSTSIPAQQVSNSVSGSGAPPATTANPASPSSLPGPSNFVVPAAYADLQALYDYWPELQGQPMPEVKIEDPAEVEYVSEYLFSNYLDNHLERTITPEDWAALVGAPPGAKVTVQVPGNDPEIGINVKHEWYSGSQVRTLYKHFNGRNHDLILHGELWVVSETSPKGTGIKVFAAMVKAAQKLGFKKIENYAAGNSAQLADGRGQGTNGYYTWPRFGYNAPIPAYLRPYLPNSLQDAHDLRELYNLPGGAKWWRENGNGLNLEFNLAENSDSMQILKDYLETKGISWE